MSHNYARSGLNLADLDDSLDASELIAIIKLHLDERLAICKKITAKQEYLQVMYNLPDIFMEYFCVLTKVGVANHQWLWLLVLHGLTEVSMSMSDIKGRFSSILDLHMTNTFGAQNSLFQQVARYCETFFDEVDVCFLVDNVLKVACTKFLELTETSLSLYVPEPHLLKYGSFVESALLALMRLYEKFCENAHGNEIKLRAFKVNFLPALVELAKCSFHTGSPLAILPLAFSNTSIHLPVSDNFVTSIILDAKVTLPLITNYYKYFGFCLVTCAVEGHEINEKMADLADIFFKVLLSFPHLQYKNYIAEATSSNEVMTPMNPQLVSGIEREEISFFYLLNSLIRLRSLSDFVDPDPAFIRERRFFIASFNKRCGAELDYSASASLSRTGSVVSMTKLAEMRGVLQNKSHANVTLSSILSEGSYIEKVRLVAEFFNLASETGGPGSIKQLIETFDMSGLHCRTNNFDLSSHDVLRIFNRIDSHQNPGKISYIKALDMIVRLLQLVSLKFYRSLYGPGLDLTEILSRQFKTNYLLLDILLVKPLLAIDQDHVVSFQYRKPTSEFEYLLKQFHMIESTQSLQQDAHKLV